MHLLSVIELFPGKTIQALCWTLVHSLWLGLLLAVVAGSIILSTKRSRAVVRYNLLTASFLFFSAGIVIIFCVQLTNISEKTQLLTAITGTTVTEKNIPVIPGALNKNNTPIINNIVSFLNEYASIIVFAWFLIIAFRLTGLISGLYDLHKLRSRQLSDPGEYWNDRLQSLAAGLGIPKQVRFFQSGIAKIPMVLGHFKPIILFPVALLATLPQDEVEVILVHELAHIRRRDYLVNMFQHFMEIFFFFNPAVLWVSALIKAERENCCDDIAVAQTGNKRNYINALLSFQEYNIDTSGYVIGLTNKKYYLLQRVKRIIYNNNKTLNAMEKTFLASGLVLAGFFVLAFSHTELRSPGKSNAVIQSPNSPVIEKIWGLSSEIKDTIPVIPKNILKEKGMTNLNTIVDGKRYDLKLANDLVTELTIDGEKVPDGKIADYKTITDGIIKQACENIAREIAMSEKAMQLAELSKLDAEKSMIMAKKLQELAIVKDQQELVLSEKLKELAIVKEQQPLVQEQKLKELSVASPELKATESLLKELSIAKDQQSLILAKKEKELIELVHSQTLMSLNQNAELEKVKSLLLKLESEKSLLKAKELQKKSQTTSTEIINDLISEKIIKNKKNLSFTLNNNELIVNGVKQPDAIHQKLKEKYIKEPDWNFKYNDK